VFLVLDDVLALSDGGECVDFVDGALFELAILLKFFDGNDFDSEHACLVDVEGPKDFSVVALSYFLNEGIVINDFNHYLYAALYINSSLWTHRERVYGCSEKLQDIYYY
jgi:hypothetical protein